MDEMTAFERQVARRLEHHAGPVRPVDDAAIFAAITATPSPKLRFQNMFSAAKFAVAGAIVALFGGFLLSGVLTQRHSDEPLPPAAASASASPEAVATATPEEPMHSDILPGVDLVTEEVEPSVYRVVRDGIRDLPGRVHDVTVTPEGDVWVEVGRPRNWRIVRLGERGAPLSLESRDRGSLDLSSEGKPVVTSEDGIRVFEGGVWTRAELTAFEACVLQWGVTGPDGDCWWQDGALPAGIDVDGSLTKVTAAELGLNPDMDIIRPEAGPDGTLWSAIWRGEGRALMHFEGLLTYDGTAWSVVPYEAEDFVTGDLDIGVGSDGTVWVAGPDDLLSWDAGSWTRHAVELPNDRPRSSLLPVRPWPNGTVWFGDSTRWEGSTLEAIDPAGDRALYAPGQGPEAIGPDGSAWTVIGRDLYVVTPEPIAATE